MTFAQRRNRLTTHFSERIPIVKRRMTVFFLHNFSPTSLSTDGMRQLFTKEYAYQ